MPPQRGGGREAGAKAPATLFLRGFFLSCQKETPQTPKRKPLWCVSVGKCCLLRVSRFAAAHPGVGWLCTSPTVHCFASLAALSGQIKGGQGGEAPHKRRDKYNVPNHAKYVRGRAPPAPPISHARARQRGRRIKVPFCLSKMGHIRKPRVVSGRNSPSIGMAARIGRPKSPAGFACRGYLILRL